MAVEKFERFGKYILLEKLASGGMAEVYLAISAGAKGVTKFFAIKRILPQFSDTQEYIDMFVEEAKVAVNLSHQNVVNIFEFGLENGQFFIVQDFIDGKNLKEVISTLKKQNKSFSTDKIVYLMKEVAAGLDHSHNCIDRSTGKPHSIIHRDISPHNIMLNFKGEVKIIDFGIAKSESVMGQASTGVIRGKLGYMSPEQIEMTGIDGRTDIFSTGIMFWELLTGDKLFMAKSSVEAIRRISNCHVPPVTEKNPEIDEELSEIVLKCLKKNPNERYQSAGDLYKALNRYLNQKYPDFSFHEVSNLVHGAYAKEILQRRVRMAKYSEIEYDPAGDDSQLEDLAKTIAIAPGSPSPYKHSDPQTRTETDTLSDSLDYPSDVHDLPASGTHSTSSQSYKLNTGTYSTRSAVSSSISVRTRKRTFWGRRSDLEKFMMVFAGVFFPAFIIAFVPDVRDRIFPTPVEEKVAPQPEPVKTVVQPPVKQKQAQPKPAPDIRRPAQRIQPVAIQKVEVFVSSYPKGAQVFLNRHPTGQVTPTILKLPPDSKVAIGLKLKGHLDFESPLTKVAEIPAQTIDTIMKRLPYGWIDIEVHPLKGSQIFIDGQLIQHKGKQIRKYRVNSDKEIVVSVKNRKLAAYKTQRIKINPGEKELIYFSLKD